MPILISERTPDTRAGVWSAALAFFLWGILPIYWKEVESVPAMEILAHRIVWSFGLLMLFIIVTGRFFKTFAILKDRQILIILIFSSFVISLNWFLFIWAVNNGYIIATSLAYFLTPVFNIICGTLIFKDRPGKAQWAAIILAATGVGAQVVVAGELPVLALGLGFCATLYAVLRKLAPVQAIPGLCVETMFSTPVALAYLGWLWYSGSLHFGVLAGPWQTVFLGGAGLVTSFPMVLYTYGIRNISLITLALLQYITPSIYLVLGVFVYREAVGLGQALSFIFIWIGLIIYTLAGLRQHYHVSRMMKVSKPDSSAQTP